MFLKFGNIENEEFGNKTATLNMLKVLILNIEL
jgi:hypothetical protein